MGGGEWAVRDGGKGRRGVGERSMHGFRFLGGRDAGGHRTWREAGVRGQRRAARRKKNNYSPAEERAARVGDLGRDDLGVDLLDLWCGGCWGERGERGGGAGVRERDKGGSPLISFISVCPFFRGQPRARHAAPRPSGRGDRSRRTLVALPCGWARTARRLARPRPGFCEVGGGGGGERVSRRG